MSDTVVLVGVAATCQDGVAREGCTLVVREGQYVFLDADNVALEGERRVTAMTEGSIVVTPSALGRITRKYGPILQ